MFNANNLYQLGIPRDREIVGLALKGANKSVSDGVNGTDIAAILEELALSEHPLEVDLGKAQGYLSDLAAKLSEARKTHRLFFERKAPALWKSWADDGVESSAVQQMINACRLPISYGGALMPDAHTGYGLPIGGVLAVENAVIPYAVGVDIACRMRISILDIPYEEYDQRKQNLTDALESQTMFGVGVHYDRNNRLDHKVMEHHSWNEIHVLKEFFEKAHSQLGTSGSGNHFVEFGKLTVDRDIDEPRLKIKAGTYLALLSHSGSRGAGEAVAKYYSSVAMSYHHELPQELKHLAWLSMDSAEGQEYWEAMQLMGLYASANHELIHKRIIDYLGCSTLGYVENHHNFAWKEMYDNKELIIHRKGATPAGLGVLGVIPGSMGTSGFIVRGKGNPDSFSSCSHGAGRLMSRKAAFKTLNQENMLQLLRDKGITLLSGELDESPEVYKDIEKVMTSQHDLVDILARFDPRLVKMSGKKF